MKPKLTSNSRLWRRELLLLFLLLIFGSSGVRAGDSFGPGSKITHQPTVAEPWIVVDLMFYDTNGSDGFFLHDSNYTDAQGNSPAGPALFVDGNYVCSPDWELAWPGGGDGADDWLEKERGNNAWWTNFYTKAYDNITYKVRFWDPGKRGDNKFYVYLYVFLSRWEVGQTHTVTIKGRWRINDTSDNTITYSWTTEGFSTPFSQAPTLVMDDYNHALVSGSLNTGHGPTTVGGSAANSWASYVAPGEMDGGLKYNQGTASFKDLSIPFSRSDYYNAEYKYVEYVIQEKANLATLISADKDERPDVTIFQWYKEPVPGFIKASSVGYTTDQWNKSITLNWSTTGVSGASSNGTWLVYRGNALLTSTGLSSATRSFTDTSVPQYGTNYTYKIVFVPKNGKETSELSTTISAKIQRSFSFSNLVATNDNEDNIVFSWNHTAIQNASSSTSYSMTVERSTDKVNWTTMQTISITNSSTNSGSFTDTKDLKPFTTYYYRLKINVLDATYESGIATGMLSGMSRILSFEASRGTYTSMVKLRWEVKQVGSTTSYFTLYRRPLGTSGDKGWSEIYTTSGTAATYSYDDVTAQVGSYNEYKIAVWTMNGETRVNGMEAKIDGFSVATGIVSGRITYGTGSAVPDAKVTLKKQSEDGELSSGMRSVRFEGEGSGIYYQTDEEEIQDLFSDDFTLQMYLYPVSAEMTSNGADYLTFDVFNVFTIRLYYRADRNAYQLGAWMDGNETTPIYLPADEWSHITFIHDHDAKTTKAIYTNGESFTTANMFWGKQVKWTEDALEANSIIIANDDGLDHPRGFKGYFDEFRFFTRALTVDEVKKNYNHPLAGNESGLAIYYPFDEGLAVQNLAYDLSKSNGASNGRHAMTKVSATSSENIPNADQLSLMTYTDEDGNYTIRGIPFSGEGDSYSIMPSLGVHDFSPSAQSRYVSASSLIHSGVDFEDVSSFPVSGKVMYANTDYPVEGASLYVDGNLCSREGEAITTDQYGEFTISVPIGKHSIKVEKNGHVFANGGRFPPGPEGSNLTYPFEKEEKNLEFIDETLVNFTGRVVGGDIQGDKTMGFALSQNNIGVTEIVLSPQNELYRMNIVKEVSGTTYSYDANKATLEVPSASKRIGSTSWRGAGEDCKKFFIRTDPNSGEFSAMLPPLQYKISSMKVVKSGLSVGEPQNIDLTNPNMEMSDTLYAADGSVEEIYSYNTLLKQVYHSTPTFIVKQEGHDDGSFGISSYKLTDELGELEVNDIYSVTSEGQVAYKYGGPIFVKEDPYTFLLEGYEEYTNADTKATDHVPLAGNVVTINNALSASAGVYVEDGVVDGNTVKAGEVATLEANQLKLDDDGKATYKWQAGLPNIATPFTRTIAITYNIGDRSYQWSSSGLAGIILGDLPTGNNFVTAGPDKLLMVLRDPPGSNSFAEWTSGSSTTKTRLRGNTMTQNNSVTFQHKFGVHTETIVGTPGVGNVIVAEAKDDLTVGGKMDSQLEDSQTKTTVTSISRAISTSAAPEYVGAQGDVFVGTSTNLIFGKARNVGFYRKDGTDEVELNLQDIISTGMEFGTMFNYTQNYIENVLFPNLELIRKNMLTTVANQAAIDSYKNTSNHNVYLTLLSPDDEKFGTKGTYKAILPANPEDGKSYVDSVIWVTNQIDNWKGYLRQNEEAKVKAFANREKYLVGDNISFDSGSTMTYTSEIDSSTVDTWDWSVAAGLIAENSFGFEIQGFGIECKMTDETLGGRHEVDEDGTSTTTSISYTFAEDGDDDALSVDVLQYDAFGPIFHTRGGQTCCPYEGSEVTKYYEPGTSIMEATMQIEVPQIDVEVPILTDIPSGGAANFTLMLSNASEIDEDVYYRLIVDDESNPNGANLSIDGKPVTDSRVIKIPAGTTVTKALQLKQTNSSILDYEDIALVLASQCQYDPTSTWDVITDTVRISAHFVPSSSEVHLALSNTLLNTQTGTNLDLTFSGFDRNYRGLKAFRLQYKKQGSSDWTLLREYVLDAANVTTSNELLPKTGGSVVYTLPMEAFTDGEYVFRVVSVSTYGADEISRTSEEIAVVKDMQRPRPLGQPEPTDGILGIGEELSVLFNEAILKGELTKMANFKVTGVLNGATVDHATALSLESVATTESAINLAGKDFSIDAWVNINGAGQLLSHGSGSTKFIVSADAENHLVVDIAGNTYTSTATMPTGYWSFLTLSYKATDDGGNLHATIATDDQTTQLFVGKAVGAYQGNGPLAVGQNATAAMHELLLWDVAHDISEALMQRSQTKNPATQHLIGYWKMNEGEGSTLTDYARSRNMSMTADTWYLNNKNKAVNLDGKSYLAMNMAESPYTKADDYAIELWMKTGSQEGASQLLQAGDIALWLNETGQLQLTTASAFWPDDEQTVASTSAALNDNAWHHVALNVLRQGAAAVYVDGERCLTASAAAVGSMATDNIIIGARRTTEISGASYIYDRYLNGQIDEVRVWNATLNATRLADNRRVRLTGTEDGLVAYYPFEISKLNSYNQIETVGTASDMSGTKHEALLNGSSNTLSYTDEAPGLRTKPEETNVNFTFTASDDKVVLEIDEDAAAIEGCTLNFTVRDVRDTNGNYSLPIVWSAFVNQNELEWMDDLLTMECEVTSSASVAATIVNKSGTQQMWTLTDLPSWLSADVTYGSTNPNASSVINFTVSDAISIGRYEHTLYVTSNNGIPTPLTITAHVVGDEPDWSVDKGGYEESMNLIGTLRIEGLTGEDTDDLVGAFIGNECRGVAHPEYQQRYDSYYVTIDIYGNKEDAKQPVEFKVYDASSGITYPVVKTYLDGSDTPTEIKFEANNLIGRYATPVVLAVTDEIEQNIAIGKGWNWISFGVKPDDFSLSSVFAKADGLVEFLKTYSGSTAEYNGTKWITDISALNNREMFAIQATDDLTLNVTGHQLKTTDEPITVSEGWSWVAYNGLSVLSVNEALAGMDPQNDEIIKGQRGVAYFDNYEWSGSLRQLTPGQGYKIQGKEARTFTYPVATANSVRMAPRRTSAESAATTSVFTPIDYRSYPTNMVVIAQVVSGGEALVGAEIGAFVNQECREAAVTDERGMIYITVPGDELATVHFYVADGENLMLASESVIYETDAVYGSPSQPLLINLDTATSVQAIGAASDKEVIYDLQGRRMPNTKLARGIYIVNNKKQVRK